MLFSKNIVMSDIFKSLQSTFDKISEFFDLFDLSFFVSGSIASSAIYLWIFLNGNTPLATIDGWLKILTVTLTFYVSGLICFAAGRWIRTEVRRKGYEKEFKAHFMSVLEDHGLISQEPFKEYLQRENLSISRLYTRLWAEVRQSPALMPSFSLIKRYWVMAATYDGIAISLVIWIFMISFWCLGIGFPVSLDWKIGILVILSLIFAFLACSREAGRYGKYQVEELVASIATQRAKKE